jgi:uncharacterized membrane protein
MTRLRLISITLLIMLSITVMLWLQSDANSQLWVVITFGSIVPVLLLIGALRKSRNWGNLIALAMIFYATVGVMDVVASSGEFLLALAVATISIALFFTSIYAERG